MELSRRLIAIFSKQRRAEQDRRRAEQAESEIERPQNVDAENERLRARLAELEAQQPND